MSRETVRVEMADGVLRLVLDRPEHKNSLTPESVRTLIEALERAATDDDARVVSIEVADLISAPEPTSSRRTHATTAPLGNAHALAVCSGEWRSSPRD